MLEIQTSVHCNCSLNLHQIFLTVQLGLLLLNMKKLDYLALCSVRVHFCQPPHAWEIGIPFAGIEPGPPAQQGTAITITPWLSDKLLIFDGVEKDREMLSSRSFESNHEISVSFQKYDFRDELIFPIFFLGFFQRDVDLLQGHRLRLRHEPQPAGVDIVPIWPN